jgi:predicted Rossmann-fold nucleotide-binding protein
MISFFERRMVTEGTISASDIDMLRITDSIDEAMVHVKSSPFCDS